MITADAKHPETTIVRHRLELKVPFESEHKTAVSPYFEINPLTSDLGRDFRLVRDEVQGDDGSITRVISVPQAWHSRIQPGGSGGISILLMREGVAIGDFDQQHVELEAGDAVLIDHEKPFVLALGRHSATLFHINRRLWVPEAGKSIPHGVVLPEHHPLTKLFGAQLDAAYRLGPKVPAAVLNSALVALVDIIAYAVTNRISAADTGLTPSRRALRARASALVDLNIENPRLTPQLLAKLVGTSRAALYRVFELDEGVAAFIQARRLDHSLVVLHNAEKSRLTIGTIAYRHGFNSEAHFSRAFKIRFGITPTQARLSKTAMSTVETGLRPTDSELARRYMAFHKTGRQTSTPSKPAPRE